MPAGEQWKAVKSSSQARKFKCIVNVYIVHKYYTNVLRLPTAKALHSTAVGINVHGNSELK